MEDTRFTWNRAFNEALDYDAWGQVEEAVNAYLRLQVAAAVEHVENVLELPRHMSNAIGHLAAILKLRMQELTTGAKHGVGLSGMQAMKPFVAGLIISDVLLPAELLPAVKAATAAAASAAADSSIQQQLHERSNLRSSIDSLATTIYRPNDAADSVAELSSRLSVNTSHQPVRRSLAGVAAAAAAGVLGTMRPPPDNLQPGDITLRIDFGSWGVKGAAAMAEAQVVITVRDGAGKLLEAVQESPAAVACPTDPSRLILGFSWCMQTPLNRLGPDAAAFFELRHYKQQKKKKSVKCFALLELAELSSAGPAVLEVYKKPADLRRKGRPTLLTSRPLFLHLSRHLVTTH